MAQLKSKFLKNNAVNQAKLASEAGGWKKFQHGYYDLNAPSTTYSLQLFDDTLPVKSLITGVLIKTKTDFSGGAISALTMTIGDSNDNSSFLGGYTFDLFSAASDTNFYSTFPNSFPNGDFDYTDTVNLYFTATGDNLEELTTGEVEIWIKYETLP